MSSPKFLKIWIPSALIAGLTGCLSMQNQPSIEEMQKEANAGAGGNKPYVEAYVEYRGPQEKWAGPTTFLLHVTAKDAGIARIAVTPALFGTPVPKNPQDQDGTTTGSRSLASRGMAGETARKHMADLAAQLQGGDELFRGCLSPVRVRLIRADGGILEKQGCRSATGWAKGASEAVHQFIASSLAGN